MSCRRLRSTSGCSTWPAHPRCSGRSATRSAGKAWSPRRRGWCSRSRSGATWRRRGPSTTPSARCSTSLRSSASTTTSARRACRTCSSPGSPTPCSNRCGTRAGSTTSRSPPPNRSASAPAATTTTGPARCATCCRTTCLQVLCLVAMEPPTYVDRETVRDEKLKVLQALKPLSADEMKRQTVTGQYGPGLAEGAVVDGYRRRRRKRRTAQRKRSWRSRPRSTTGAGPACRSICAPASGCRSDTPRSLCSSNPFRCRCFRAARDHPSRIGW